MASIQRAPLCRGKKMNGKYFSFLSPALALSQQFERGSCSASRTVRSLTCMHKVLFLLLGVWSFASTGN